MAAAERISAKRYGVRYGRRLREKIGKLEKEKRDSNMCIYCRYKKVKRVSVGIWYCSKCDSKFTGRAYVIGKKVVEDVLTPAEKPVEAAVEMVPEKIKVENG